MYISDGLLILNKPYGLGLSPPPITAAQHSHHTEKMVGGQSQYYLTEALPHIAEHLGYNNLTVLKIPERFVLYLVKYRSMFPGVILSNIFWNCTPL
jgi:hypothetical protein